MSENKPKYDIKGKEVKGAVVAEKITQITQHHYHEKRDNSPKYDKRLWYETPLIVTVAIAFLALLLTIILCVFEKKTGIKGQVIPIRY